MKIFDKLNLLEEERAELLEEAGEVLFERVLDRAVENLNPVDREELDDLLHSSHTEYEEIMSFLEERIPYLYDLVGQEVFELEREINTMQEAITA